MRETEAARAVLLEVLNALGAMGDDLVIVGGWVPDLLYPSSNHMGSLDVDLAVSPKAIGGNAYSSIRAASSAGDDAAQFQRAAYEDAVELFRRLDAI